MDTKNKIVLVTVGSRGLGRDMALNLAKNGIDVIQEFHKMKRLPAPQHPLISLFDYGKMATRNK